MLLLISPVGATAKRPAVFSPTADYHDYDARIAANGGNLYLATVGTNAWGDYMVRLHRYDGRRWTRLPGRLPTLYDRGLQLGVIGIGAGDDIPCIGDSPRDAGRIRCFGQGTWHTLASPTELEGFAITGLRGDGPNVTASFARWNEDGTTTVRVAKSDGQSITLNGPPLLLPGQILADLGETTDNPQAAIDVGLQTYSDPGSGQHVVATLEGGSWTLGPALPVRHGARPISGPVRSGSSLFMATPSERPWPRSPLADWPFSVFRLGDGPWDRVSGKILSQGRGANQGGVFAIGDRVWAVWWRIHLNRRGSTKNTIEAARFSADGSRIDRRFKLVRSGTEGPRILQATAYRGRPAFLYGTTTKSGRWRAVVDLNRR